MKKLEEIKHINKHCQYCIPVVEEVIFDAVIDVRNLADVKMAPLVSKIFLKLQPSL